MRKTKSTKRSSSDAPKSQIYEARNKFNEGWYKESSRLCEALYCVDPSNVENLLVLAACHFQLNRMKESAFYAQQAIGICPSVVEAHATLGNCLKETGDMDAAVEIYNKAIRIHPRLPNAYASLGCIHLEHGCVTEAISCFEMAVSLNPRFVEAMTNLGRALVISGDTTGGKTHLLKAIKQKAKPCAITWLNLGNIAHEEGDFGTAIENYTRALKLEPTFLDAHSNLCGSLIELFRASGDRSHLQNAVSRLDEIIAQSKGCQHAYCKLAICHRLQGRYKLAIRHFWHAVMLDPSNTDSVCNLGGLHAEAGNENRAIKLCLRALKENPKAGNEIDDNSKCFNMLGFALFRLGSTGEALKCFQVALKLKPDYPGACCNLAAVLIENGDSLLAAKLCKQAIALDPFMISAFLNLGNAYFDCGKTEYAEKCYQTCIDSKSEYDTVAFNNLLLLQMSRNQFDDAAYCSKQMHQRLHRGREPSSTLIILDALVCRWDRRRNDFESVSKNAEKLNIQPFYAKIIPQITPEILLCLADMFSIRAQQRALYLRADSFGQIIPPSDRPIKIGYVSSGFGNTTTGFLVQGIFARHNKAKFQVSCYSLTPSDGSKEWDRIDANSGSLVDISQLNCADAATKINEDGVHVLVDLDGYQNNSRPEIFALRPAPIQITMNCGTTGSKSGIDYIVGDAHNIPESDRSHFRENIIYVPHIVNSYKDNCTDNLNIDSSEMRQDYGICDDAFVYACFSHGYKIDPELFAVWMEILHKVPHSLLVLIRYSATMEKNLREEASKCEISGDRIKFLDLVPRDEHLKRCCVADVFLDTRVCGGIATGCDAIWSRTPFISLAGDRMCNRVGASMLASVGLQQLVASNLIEYKNLAITLSEDEDRYMDIIRLLDNSRDESELFDCQLWVNSFEAAIESTVHRYRQGLKPEHFVPQGCGV